MMRLRAKIIDSDSMHRYLIGQICDVAKYVPMDKRYYIYLNDYFKSKNLVTVIPEDHIELTLEGVE